MRAHSFADGRSAAADSRARAVLSWLDQFVGALDVSDHHRALLRVHLGVGRAQIEGRTSVTATQLPLLVYAALTGSEAPATPLAGACTLLYLGADLLDNIADAEVTPEWDDWSAAQMQLAASTYLASLWQKALAALRATTAASDDRLWSLSVLFSDALLEMSAGQHEDFRLYAGGEVTVEGSRRMVERKSGAEIALFAQSAALLATGDAARAAHFAEFGRCCGAASQIGSDVTDLWDGNASRDLTNGKCTLPIAHALSRCQGAERDRLLSLLALCRHTPSAHAEVRQMLLGMGSLRYTALVIEVYRQRARAHLEQGLDSAQGSMDAIAELRDMAAALALFPVPERAPAHTQESTHSLEREVPTCATT